MDDAGLRPRRLRGGTGREPFGFLCVGLPPTRLVWSTCIFPFWKGKMLVVFPGLGKVPDLSCERVAAAVGISRSFFPSWKGEMLVTFFRGGDKFLETVARRLAIVSRSSPEII